MATTLENIKTSVAYRLGYDAAESGNAVSARWTSYINSIYMDVMRKHYWWFSEASTAFDSVADQEYYDSTDGFPTDLRGSAILELRYNNTLYTPMLQSEAFNSHDSDYNNRSESYFIFNKALYPVPRFTASGTDNITMKYYKMPALLSASSDAIIIPDEYADLLASGAAAKISQVDDMRGSAADFFDEYNNILEDMNKAQNDYMFALKSNEFEDNVYSEYAP